MIYTKQECIDKMEKANDHPELIEMLREYIKETDSPDMRYCMNEWLIHMDFLHDLARSAVTHLKVNQEEP